MRVAYVYPNPRSELVRLVAEGNAPDTALLGQNHLAAFGIEAWIHEPRLRRRQRASGFLHRLTWNARELTLPWELRAADVVCTPLANLLPLLLNLTRGPRTVLFNWGLNTALHRATRPRRAALRAAVRSAAATVCLGESQRTELLALTGAREQRLHTVPFGVDASFFRPEAGRARYILAVGRDLARDYATLAAAVRTLELEVVVVALPRNLTGVELPRNVRFEQNVSYLELRALYRDAACVVLPLRRPKLRVGTEASGLTALLEAFACGKPLVATDRPIIREYLAPESSGLLVEPEQPEQLRQAIERVLSDSELAGRLGRGGRAFVEAQATTRHLAAALSATISAVARAAGR